MRSDRAVLTCALTGILTNPKTHPVPVSPQEMAQSARDAVNAGASVLHLHFRRQEAGLGHLPSWEPEVARSICDAIRDACPEVVLNLSTGVLGDDISGPLACLEAVRPESAALNAGSLNYLKLRSSGAWAWPPMLFDNPVEKIERYLTKFRELNVVPECECFDTGIVRSVAMFEGAGMLPARWQASFVMGVASGMPLSADLLPILLNELPAGAHWQTIAIGRDEVWDIHRACAELGGHLRTGVEDTFYLPSGERTSGNGPLIEALAAVAREAGREPATPQEVRAWMHGP